MITLYQFHRVWGLPNASPFCMKVETYLRMAKLPYENHFLNNPHSAPKGKFPYIKLDGNYYPDSEFIIDELKNRYGNPLDNTLTEEQKAVSQLIETAFAERLYWIAVYLRWQDDAGWALINKQMFGRLPAFSKLFVPKIVRKKMLQALYNQGTGRHTFAEVIRMGSKTIDAIATILGDKPYFMGDKPTAVDATAFGFLANMIWAPLDDPLKQHVLEHENIRAYCIRMWDAYYPDMTRPEF